MEPDLNDALLQVSDLCVHFAARHAWFRRAAPPLRAVQDVSFSIAPREIVGLVGESGSGKSTLARAILRLLDPTSGSIRFEGVDLLGLEGRALKSVRRGMQVIFQDPYASLNPRMTAGQNVAEGLLLQDPKPSRTPAAVADLLHQVGLPRDAAHRFPHEFSGGQRQRIGIARALAVQPRLVIADEPVSALDMSVQAQILNLLLDKQQQRGLALLFIGHDLSVIRHFCDRVLVLYLGRIVESGTTEQVFSDPRHPYTRALIDAAPVAHPARRRQRGTLCGDPPSPIGIAAGCAFRTRCAYAMDACAINVPGLRQVSAQHSVACLRDDLHG
jgi:oligopeptide/dipeptide ABC transporter ATP-binding protein